MSIALQYAWILPAAIGVAGVLYFGLPDLKDLGNTMPQKNKSED